jgi:hypothetical protein
LFEHDLFGKPVPTFSDHALAASAMIVRRLLSHQISWICEEVLALENFFPAADELRSTHGADQSGG